MTLTTVNCPKGLGTIEVVGNNQHETTFSFWHYYFMLKIQNMFSLDDHENYTFTLISLI